MSEHVPILEVDLGAIVRNWRNLSQTHAQHSCAAVVKANAYGLGVDEIVAALADAGCQHFFVATLEEAVELRELLTSAFIYVFDGVQNGEETDFLEYNLLPVLNSMAQLDRWAAAAQDIEAAGSVLHVDTGINRLGLRIEEAEKLALQPEKLEQAQVRLLMSHLACASEPRAKLNQLQLDRFIHLRQCFPALPASLANSAGVFMDKSFHQDIARPGCALYGINPFDDRPNPVEPVATLSAPVLQVRTIENDHETIGYGATATAQKGARIATVAIGYADGLHRILSDSSLHGYIEGHAAPLIGRVSMDLITLDVSHIPEHLAQEGSRVELINKQQDVNAIARAAQTIGYEIFTRLSMRVKRAYHGHGQVN